jgi:hypothetical protein
MATTESPRLRARRAFRLLLRAGGPNRYNRSRPPMLLATQRPIGYACTRGHRRPRARTGSPSGAGGGNAERLAGSGAPRCLRVEQRRLPARASGCLPSLLLLLLGLSLLVQAWGHVLKGDGAPDFLAREDGLLLPPHEDPDVAPSRTTVGRHCLCGCPRRRVAATGLGGWGRSTEGSSRLVCSPR